MFKITHLAGKVMTSFSWVHKVFLLVDSKSGIKTDEIVLYMKVTRVNECLA